MIVTVCLGQKQKSWWNATQKPLKPKKIRIKKTFLCSQIFSESHKMSHLSSIIPFPSVMIVLFSLHKFFGTQEQSGSSSYLNIFCSSSSSPKMFTVLFGVVVVTFSSLPRYLGGKVLILALWSLILLDSEASLIVFLFFHQNPPSNWHCTSDTQTNKIINFILASWSRGAIRLN